MTVKHCMMQCGHVSNAVTTRNGVEYPVCSVHFPNREGVTPIEPPDITGRKAKCYCGKIVDSSFDLPFYGYRGPGSHTALFTCKNCGYYQIAHEKAKEGRASGNICDNFEPHGGYDYDEYYCGHYGWS